MIFHQPDSTFKRLSACWKRAEKLAGNHAIDKNHPLAAAWENCKMFVQAEGDNPTKEDIKFTLCCLDWFALKLDEYSRTNILSGDDSIAAMLFEFKQLMPINPTFLIGNKCRAA